MQIEEVELVEEDKRCIHVFDKFLNFFYSGKVDFNAENISPLLILADKYGVSGLLKVCI